MSYQYLKNNVLLGVFGVTSFCFITTHVAVVLCINGNSMEPTLLDGDRVLVAKWDRPVRFDGRQSSRYNPTRGDIVVLRSPQKPKERLVKRILGFEGDVIRTRPSVDKTETVRINPGQMWIEGDNSRGSMDSNTYGQEVPTACPYGLNTDYEIPLRGPVDPFSLNTKPKIPPTRDRYKGCQLI